MTDGRQTRDPDALDLNVAAKPIHDQGVRVLVVGIGPEISDDELRLIARDSSYVFKVETFENLKKATQDVASTACINPSTSVNYAFKFLLVAVIVKVYKKIYYAKNLLKCLTQLYKSGFEKKICLLKKGLSKNVYQKVQDMCWKIYCYLPCFISLILISFYSTA